MELVYDPIEDAIRYLRLLKRQSYSGIDLEDAIELCKLNNRNDIIDKISQGCDNKIVFEYNGDVFSFYPIGFYGLAAVSYYAHKGYLSMLNDKMFDK